MTKTLAFEVFHRSARGIGLGIARIESDAVEEGLRRVVGAAMGITDFLHGLLIEIGAHDALGNALIVGCAGDHAPAAVLREKPLGILGLRIVAVPLAEM